MFMPKTRKGSPLEMGWCGVRPAKTVQVHLQTCMMPRPKEKKKNFAGIPNKSSNLFSHVFSSEIRWNFGLKAAPTHSRNRTGTHLKPR